MITFSNILQFLKSVRQGRKMPVAELCSDAVFIGSYYHFLFWHVEQPLTGTMRWAPPLLCHRSLTGYLEMFCYSVCLADRFLFSLYQPIHIRCSYVWVWGFSGKEARLVWSFLEMACAPCGYLKNTPVQSKCIFFSWTYTLGFTSSYIHLHPSQILCLLLRGFFPCLLRGPEMEISILVGITRLCSKGHQQHRVSQYG